MAVEHAKYPFLSALGARVKELRQERGWTLEDVANRTGLSKTALSEIERGLNEPSAGTLWRLARALRTSLDWLVCGDWREEEA